MELQEALLLSLVFPENFVEVITMICPSCPLDKFHFPAEAMGDQSGDQRLHLDYSVGISRGKVNFRFPSRKIGLLNKTRCLTLAIRLMMKWIRGAYPPKLSDKLHIIVQFVIQVYAVIWLKKDNNFYSLQQYIFYMIQRIKKSTEIQYVALKNVSTMLLLCSRQIFCHQCGSLMRWRKRS